MPPTVHPTFLDASPSCLDYQDLAIWEMPEFLGFETCAYMPGNVNSIVAHNVGHYRFWIDDNGTPKALDPKTFGQQFPSFATAALELITQLLPWSLAEIMDRTLGFTEDGENDSVIILFCKNGPVGFGEQVEMIIDDYAYGAKNGFDSLEEAEDHIDDCLNPGKLCTLFGPANPSAHTKLEWIPRHQETLNTWKRIITTDYPDVTAYMNWTLS